MTNFRLLPSISALLLLISCQQTPTSKPDIFDQKADLLLTQLTLEEKVAQLKVYSFAAIAHYTNQTTGEVNIDSLKKYFPHGVGGVCVDKGLEPIAYMNVEQTITNYNNTTRMKIPVIYQGEALHGFMCMQATVFPQAISLGCSWDPAMLEKCYDVAAKEAAVRGVKHILSPILDLAREPRFGRIEEMYSEDPYLVGECGKAAVIGLQGRSRIPDSNHVAATLKHFMGHGIPEGGRNMATINISNYDLLNEQMPPFAKCIDAGVISVMPSYNEINGVPNHASKWLIKDILAGELGFNGPITGDQNALDELYRTHSIAASPAGAAKLAIENGIDLDIRYQTGTYDELVKMVKEGKLDEKYVNESAKRILALKYLLGLFDSHTLDTIRMKEVTNCEAHKKIALEAAEKSLVLLKNQNNTLPFNPEKIKTVAVIGPNAKGVHYGGYTAEPRYDGVDVLEGVENISEGKFKVLYAEGCKIAKEESTYWGNDVHTPNDEASDRQLIAEAVKVAKQSDVIILSIGETVSFSREAWGEFHLGDRDNLDLLGRQNLLVEELLKTGKPITALIFGGRPLSFNYVAQNVPSIIQVFYPGQEGGTAIANVVFGKVNPSGKLATTIPKSVGQLPCYYDRKPSRMRSYIYNLGSEPLFAFGHGLSYTTYAYGELSLDKSEMTASDSIKVSIPITNTGNMAGEEVVQLYIHDKVSTGVRPIKELKHFAKIHLETDETKTVTFCITKEDLQYYNPNLKKVVEPGEFEVFVGPNMIDLKSLVFTVK